MTAEKTSGPPEREQRQECTLSTSSDRNDEKAVSPQEPGATTAIGGSETAVSSINDQHPECTSSTSFNQRHEKAVDYKGAVVINATRKSAGDQMDLPGGAAQSTTPVLERQAGSITNDELRGCNAAVKTTVTASSASETTKDVNSAETVGGPAVLEEREKLNSSDIRGKDSAEQDTAFAKSSDDRQTMPDDQKAQEDRNRLTGQRNMTETGEDHPIAFASTTRTSKKPQQTDPEAGDLVGSDSEMVNGKNYTQVGIIPP